MNKLIAALAVSTAVCAAAAIYFRQQLVEERLNVARLSGELSVALASPPAAPAPAASSTTPPPTTPPPPAPIATSSSNDSKAVPKPAVTRTQDFSGPPVMTDAQKVAMRDQAISFFRKYNTAEGQATLREEQIRRARDALAGFDKERQLDPATFQKVIDEFADKELEKRASISRCALDPACVTPAGLAELTAARRQALQELLGEEGYDEMQKWTANEPARKAVVGLSTRLPSTAPLTAAQSNLLIAALAAEREAALRDFSNAGTHIKGFSNMDRMTLFYADQLPAEGRMASAEAYVQRSRARAATVLAGEQLIVFNQMQDELLLDFRRVENRRAAEQKP